MKPVVYLLILLRASLFSTGGFGNVPILHSDFIDRGWAVDSQFAESLAIGQISPGPNGLWVISLGYLTAGLLGAGLAFVAICIPPLLVITVDRVYDRIKGRPEVDGFVTGLSLAVIGIFVAFLFGLLKGAGLSPFTITITLLSIALGMSKKVPVAVVLATAACAGIAIR